MTCYKLFIVRSDFTSGLGWFLKNVTSFQCKIVRRKINIIWCWYLLRVESSYSAHLQTHHSFVVSSGIHRQQACRRLSVSHVNAFLSESKCDLNKNKSIDKFCCNRRAGCFIASVSFRRKSMFLFKSRLVTFRTHWPIGLRNEWIKSKEFVPFKMI